MSNLKIFDSNDFGKIRMLEYKGKPYAVAKDIADVLGYKNTNDAINKYCKGIVKYDILTVGGKQCMSIIPESDIYRLIMKSKLPSAEKFEKWVCEDVLPSIRKYGMYAKEELLNNPELLVDVAQKLIEEKNKVLQLEVRLAEQKPKVEIYDEVISQKDLLNFKQMSEIFTKYSRTKLFKLLRDEHILSNTESNWNLPYAKYKKYFRVKIRPRKTSNGMKDICTTLCTMDAVPFIKQILDKKKDLFSQV